LYIYPGKSLAFFLRTAQRPETIVWEVVLYVDCTLVLQGILEQLVNFKVVNVIRGQVAIWRSQ